MIELILTLALMASLVLNIAQGVKVKILVEKKKQETKTTRYFIKTLTKMTCNANNKNDDLIRRLEELEKQQKDSNTRIIEVERRIKELEEANGIMANNTYQLIKEERIIKSAYNNVIFPYKFHELTKDEIVKFFGRIG